MGRLPAGTTCVLKQIDQPAILAGYTSRAQNRLPLMALETLSGCFRELGNPFGKPAHLMHGSRLYVASLADAALPICPPKDVADRTPGYPGFG